jgi:hypothetical protein
MSRLRKVLLLDADRETQYFLSSLLTQEGYEVVATESVAEALSKVSCEPFSLMLIDIGLPGLEGLELLQKVRHIQPEAIPAFLVKGKIPRYPKSNPSLSKSNIFSEELSELLRDEHDNGHSNALKEEFWEEVYDILYGDKTKEEGHYVTRKELENFKRKVEIFQKSLINFILAYNSIMSEE